MRHGRTIRQGFDMLCRSRQRETGSEDVFRRSRRRTERRMMRRTQGMSVAGWGHSGPPRGSDLRWFWCLECVQCHSSQPQACECKKKGSSPRLLAARDARDARDASRNQDLNRQPPFKVYHMVWKHLHCTLKPPPVHFRYINP